MYSTLDPVQALTGSVRDFRELPGSDLINRVNAFYEWQELRREPCARPSTTAASDSRA